MSEEHNRKDDTPPLPNPEAEPKERTPEELAEKFTQPFEGVIVNYNENDEGEE